jgi:hypothetical protein
MYRKCFSDWSFFGWLADQRALVGKNCLKNMLHYLIVRKDDLAIVGGCTSDVPQRHRNCQNEVPDEASFGED